jgi:hypothetical protein
MFPFMHDSIIITHKRNNYKNILFLHFPITQKTTTSLGTMKNNPSDELYKSNHVIKYHLLYNYIYI